MISLPARTLHTYLTNPVELKKTIKTFRNGKSSGPDDISNMALKNISNKAFYQLKYAINAILQLQ